MASNQLGIAEVMFKTSLLRADPQQCSQPEIASIIAMLTTAINQCSPPNVQKCKQWALTYLVPSSNRINPFCTYLIALANSFNDSGSTTIARTGAIRQSVQETARIPSARRRRLHILYILNDILYHVKYRLHNESFAEKLQSKLPVLIQSASSFSNSPKQVKKIQDLITLWEEKGYFEKAIIAQLRTAVDQGASAGIRGQNGPEAQTPTTCSGPAARALKMPTTHGDPQTPWHDLPAANWLPHMSEPPYPMRADMIKALTLPQGPPDKALVEAVNELLIDVDRMYPKTIFSREAKSDDKMVDINEMGERVVRDEISGEITAGYSYYGWSRAFCQEMKEKKRGPAANSREDRGRTRSSRSYSRSVSRSPDPGRRQYQRRSISNASSNSSRRRNRHRSQRRSTSVASSRSTGSYYKGGRDHRRSGSRPRYGRSRSRSPRHDYSPAPASVGLPPRPPAVNVFAQNAPHAHQHANFYQQQLHQQFAEPPPVANFGGYLVPVPPAPNYQGQWPPPPPPPPVAGGQPVFFGGDLPPGTWVGGWADPPPPPPPPHQQQHHQGYQQGRGRGGYQGRSGGGGRGYGGGGWGY
ncbi:hypothetical protein B0H66DRAFT_547861 [Apodospora peruviana]|uniref:CID domain-containing protein n=1 Tax=Apodospora peruviana TaxID=516989 RepID=A0AAE0IJ27_9PEZI|nr:hypothetical protein B0H66DRAFT_547861 [Apodospora peruviana]